MTHPDYTISDQGILRNPRGLRIAKKPGSTGYHATRINGKAVKIHRLVLEAFVGPCPVGMECRHLDSDKSNNRADNLTWGTPKQNMQDRVKVEGHLGGAWKIKLTDEQVCDILKDGRTYSEIARYYGVSVNGICAIKKRLTRRRVSAGKHIEKSPRSHRLSKEQARKIFLSVKTTKEISEEFQVTTGLVHSIKAGSNWKSVTKGLTPPTRRVQGERTGTSKITEDDVRSIRKMTGTCKAVGEKFGITASAIHLIRKRRNWAHVK